MDESTTASALLPLVATGAAMTLGSLVALQTDYVSPGGVSELNDNPTLLDKNYTEYISSKNVDGMKDLITKILDKKSKETYRIIKIDQDNDDPTNEYYLYLMEETTKETEGKQQNQRYDPTNLLLYQVPLIEFCALLKEELDNHITTTTLCFVADASSNKCYDFIYGLCDTIHEKYPIGVVKEPLWLAIVATLIDDRSITTSESTINSILFSLCRLETLRVDPQIKQSKTVIMTLPGGQSMTHLLLPYLYKVFPQDRHIFGYDSCISTLQRALIKEKKHWKKGIFPKSIDNATSIGVVCSPLMINTPYYSVTSIRMIKSCVVYQTRGLLNALSNVEMNHASIIESWISSINTFLELKEEYGDENKKVQCPYLPYIMQWSILTDPQNLDKFVGNAPNNNTGDTRKCDTYWIITSLLQYITGCKSRPLPDGVLELAMEYLQNNVIPNELDEQISQKKYCNLSPTQIKDIENCCFQHKLILIGDKTLPDTVYPKQHWTLKQSLKRGGGCACCGPEDYLDEEDEEEEDGGENVGVGASRNGGDSSSLMTATAMRGDGTLDMSVPGAFAMAFQQQPPQSSSGLTNRRRGGDGGGNADGNGNEAAAAAAVAPPTAKKPKFVDGKLGFAFDPTKFS